MLTWGKSLEFLLAEKAKGLDPPALRTRPVLTNFESYFSAAFADLSESRTYSDNGYPAPIPISEYLSYFEMFKIDGLEERATMLHFLQALDRTFCEVKSEQVTERLKAASKTRSV